MKNVQRIACAFLMSISILQASQWQNKILGETSFCPLDLQTAPTMIQQVLVAENFSEADLIEFHEDHKNKNLPNNYVVLVVRNNATEIDPSSPAEILRNGVIVGNCYPLESFDSEKGSTIVANIKRKIIKSYKNTNN